MAGDEYEYRIGDEWDGIEIPEWAERERALREKLAELTRGEERKVREMEKLRERLDQLSQLLQERQINLSKEAVRMTNKGAVVKLRIPGKDGPVDMCGAFENYERNLTREVTRKTNEEAAVRMLQKSVPIDTILYSLQLTRERLLELAQENSIQPVF